MYYYSHQIKSKSRIPHFTVIPCKSIPKIGYLKVAKVCGTSQKRIRIHYNLLKNIELPFLHIA